MGTRRRNDVDATSSSTSLRRRACWEVGPSWPPHQNSKPCPPPPPNILNLPTPMILGCKGRHSPSKLTGFTLQGKNLLQVDKFYPLRVSPSLEKGSKYVNDRVTSLKNDPFPRRVNPMKNKRQIKMIQCFFFLIVYSLPNCFVVTFSKFLQRFYQPWRFLT